MISRNHKKLCKTLNYIDYFLILVSTGTGCVSISCFASLVGILAGVASSAIGIKIWVIKPVIKKYKSIIKKKKHDKIVLLAKTKLNNVEVLISKALIDLNIHHDEFVVTNNLLKEYDNMKEKRKNPNNKYLCLI